MRFVAIFLCLCLPLLAEDIYVCQFGSGLQDGSDTNNCKSLGWLNTVGSWGAGAGKISPGDTVWLFGSFITNGANASLISIKGGGSPGSPVRIKAVDTDTLLQAQQFGHNPGAISSYTHNDLIFDGLTILNTSNGTTNSGLSFHSTSDGFAIAGSNIEFTNCTITNIFIQAGTDTNDHTGKYTWGIFLNWGCTNITIHNSTFSWAQSGIGGGPNGWPFENIEIDHNTITNCAWDIGLGYASGANHHISNLSVHHNDMAGWDIWGMAWGSYANSMYHTDGLIVFGNTTNADQWCDGIYFYNNLLHGPWGKRGNTIGCSLGASCRNGYIFNNVFSFNDTNSSPIWITGTSALGLGGKVNSNTFIFNNTIIGTADHLTGGGGALTEWAMILGGTNLFITNNIIHNFNVAFRVDDQMPFTDYNLFGSVGYASVTSSGGANPTNLAQWMANGFDTHSLTNLDPLLKATFEPYANSPVVNAGVTTTNLNILATNDYLNFLRVAPFDIGAVEFEGQSGAPPLPTNGVSTSVVSFIQRRIDSATQTFYVTNRGTDTLLGTASVATVNFILSGFTNYSLVPGAKSNITVSFGPKAAGTYSDTITLTGGGGASVLLSGTSTNFPTSDTIGKVTTAGKVTFY